MKASILTVFDFDHTLLDCNSDVEVTKLAPGGKLPDELRRLSRELGWTEYMQKVFDYLFEQGVSKEALRSFVRSLPFSPGAKEVVRRLREELGSEIVIISDANSFFIDELLDEAGLSGHVDAVFTHPAAFGEEDRLSVTRLNPGADCDKYRGRMCKGHILDGFMDRRRKEGKEFDVVAYAGDGLNDFCPMTRLPPHPAGWAFVRRGYQLEKLLLKEEAKGKEIRAMVVFWTDISEVFEALHRL